MKKLLLAAVLVAVSCTASADFVQDKKMSAPIGLAVPFEHKDALFFGLLVADIQFPYGDEPVRIINGPNGPECEKGQLMIAPGRRLSCSQGNILVLGLKKLLPEPK